MIGISVTLPEDGQDLSCPLFMVAFQFLDTLMTIRETPPVARQHPIDVQTGNLVETGQVLPQGMVVEPRLDIGRYIA
jgi:hypothetical protein